MNTLPFIEAIFLYCFTQSGQVARPKLFKVTDGQVVRTGSSVTWNVLSWSGGHGFEAVGSNSECIVPLSTSWTKNHSMGWTILAIWITMKKCSPNKIWKVCMNERMFVMYLTDVDECETPANNCPYACKNLVGTFRCICPEGYTPGSVTGDCVGKCLLSEQ